VTGSYGAFSLLVRKEQETRLRYASALGMMGLCGLLLSLVALLPQREFLGFGERAAIDYEYFSQFSFPPREIFSLFFPYFFGGAAMAPYTVQFWGAFGGTEWMGYVGMLTWLLALCGLLRWRRWGSLSWFWAGWAVLALVLSFGGYLPFELNRLLFQLPVYKLFRASGRNMLEFTFALSVLAGMGYTVLAEAEAKVTRRLLAISGLALALVLAVGGVVYRYFPAKLVTETALPPNAASLTNLEFLFPVAAFGLSLLLLGLFLSLRQRSLALRAVSGVLLVVVLLADAWSWGFFFEWRLHYYNVANKLADAPTVKFIKEREADLNSFRIASLAPRPYADNYVPLDFPNLSIARGLQSINGYDALRLTRVGEVAGGVTIDGFLPEPKAFEAEHRGFDLLNVKYLLRERPEATGEHNLFTHNGVQFVTEPLNLFFSQGNQAQLSNAQATATELVLITALGNSVQLTDGQPVLKVKLHTAAGGVVEQEVQAGRDTAEWAYDRPEVRANIKHQRPEIAESWPVENFEAHKYFARLRFDRADITNIEIAHVRDSADLTIYQASLFDATNGTATPLSQFALPPARWRKLQTFGAVEVYENLRQQPRAWFVRRAEVLPSQAVVQTIKSGKLPSGAEFNPAETVLFEKEDFGARPPNPPPIGDPTGAEVKLTRYGAHNLELQTRNAQPGLLVVSEIYYRGWEAWVDGQRAPVERVNYVLRGLALPPGEHRVEFKFRAPSFRNGALYSALGLLLLALGALGGRTGLNGKLGQRFTKLNKLSQRFSTASKVALLALLVYFGVLNTNSARAVGGSDSSGYANITRALLQGPLKAPVPEIAQFGVNPAYGQVFCPLAHVFIPPSESGTSPGSASQSPFYPIGFPLHLLLGVKLAGWETGPFLISPLLATLSLLLLFLVGKQLGLSAPWATVGVILLALNPTFLFMALQPMSDITALFWGLCLIWTAFRAWHMPYWAFAAGVSFGMAVLVRPTNVLFLAPLLFCLPLRKQTLYWFGMGGLPCAALFCAYNATAYGHPLRIGYGAIGLAQAFLFAGYGTRLWAYLGHLTITLGLLLVLAWLGVAALRQVSIRTRAMLLAWFGSFLIFYCFYNIYENWTELRFLLPSYPGLFLGACLTAQTLWQGSGQPYLAVRQFTVAVLLLVTLGVSLWFVRYAHIFGVAADQSSYKLGSRWADAQLPPRTVLVSMEMSGALRFYTRRSIFRWDFIPPGSWPELHRQITAHGYQMYALLYGHEIELAQAQVLGRWYEQDTLGPASLWRIEPADHAPPQINYVEGFSPKEGEGEHAFRWMSASGVVKLQNTGQPMRLSLTGGVPNNVFARPSQLTLTLNGAPVGQLKLTSPTEHLELVISPTQQGGEAWSELRLTTDQSFSPHEIDPASGDRRVLGLSLVNLRWERVEQ